MDVTKANSIIPVISKFYCSPSQAVLFVRKRPIVVNGGGFVVTDCNQKFVFRVEGCGVVGTDGELIVRDGNGVSLLLIRRKGGTVQALNIYRKWKGYTSDYEGSQKLVFSLKEPNSYFVRNSPIRISTNPKRNSKGWDFEIRGNFPGRACSIIDHQGNVVAQIGVKNEVEAMMAKNDQYSVAISPEMDQAFIIGVIAVLDYVYGESTRC
ncbi:hypothetical protein K2173_015939 [Erythroxylum novogranatense]|uniref:Protein LURP-one-related 6 n=1 Tax=Erythroxylum novogranatense TaxID=1862640 RepID=A0AAV8SFD4_9ROSI|nr:hypothetical protein K2173_015939 [Erythroxylum novogranatense]